MLLSMIVLGGCATLGWYGQAVRGQAEILLKREDIAEIIADPGTPEEVREKLDLALQARRFASEELDLPDNRSYTLYADLGREAVVWNVIAAPEFDLSPKTWCYPIVGCLAYRGYFRRERAEALAAELEAEGYDVLVSAVPAYSTLGRFADPVLNTMLDFDEVRLVGLIFHELAHQRIFVKGDTAFNESYATFIEREGLRRWLTARGDEQALARWRAELELRQAFTRLLLDARAALETLYASGLDEDEMRRQKRGIFDRLAEDYRDFRHRHGDFRFDGWMARDLNNAHLALVATYESGVAAFARLLAEYDGDLIRFHEAVESLAGAGDEVRAEFFNNAALSTP